VQCLDHFTTVEVIWLQMRKKLNSVMESIWKEAVIAYFKTLSQCLTLRETVENFKKANSRQRTKLNLGFLEYEVELLTTKLSCSVDTSSVAISKVKHSHNTP
jgi:hypothetical protein